MIDGGVQKPTFLDIDQEIHLFPQAEWLITVGQMAQIFLIDGGLNLEGIFRRRVFMLWKQEVQRGSVWASGEGKWESLQKINVWGI